MGLHLLVPDSGFVVVGTFHASGPGPTRSNYPTEHPNRFTASDHEQPQAISSPNPDYSDYIKIPYTSLNPYFVELNATKL